MSNIQRRDFLLTSAVALAGIPQMARADDYPARTIRLIVPYAAGGATDVIARLVAQGMSTRLKQEIYVDNRAGGGGNIGTGMGARANPDGYTLTLGTSNTLGANVSVFDKLPFNPETDFAHIGFLAFAPSLLAVTPAFPAKTVAELVDLVKRRPTEYAYASGGVGASSHFSGELFNKMIGAKMTHVPYRGDAGAIADTIGGQVKIIFCNAPSGVKFHRSGQLRVLGVTSAVRIPAYPDIPTIAESGLPDFDISAWFSLMAPAGTPPTVVAKLAEALNATLQSSTVREQIAANSFIGAVKSPKEMEDFVKSEVRKWGVIAKDSNIRVDQ